MSRRRIGLGLGIGIALLLGLLWWRHGDGGGGRGATAAKTAARAEASRAATRIDVATVARGSIAGRVVDPAGAGVAGARVCGYAYSDQLPVDETRDPFCASAGPDGRYELANLLPARYVLHAHAPRFVPAVRDDDGKLRLAAGEARTGVDLTLAPGGVEVTGVVKDIGGGTVEGAWVYLRSGVRWGPRAGGVATVSSEADGTFRAWVAPGAVQATAEADGYAEGGTYAIAPGQVIEILLTPESVLAGRVVEKQGGATVPYATVAVDGDWGTPSARTTADADGRFRLTRLPPGRYKPRAVAPGRRGRAAESVLLGLGQTVEDVVIEVHPAARITGRVVLADGETPCEGGRVELRDPAAGNEASGRIEEDGTVEIEAAAAGTYEVEVRCEGYLPVKDLPELAVADGVDPPEQRWTVGAEGARLRGVVLAHDGRPVPDAEVRAEAMATDLLWSGWGWDTTRADGTFEMKALRAGEYKVTAEADHEPSTKDPVRVTMPERGEVTVEIRLPRGGAITGMVRDERGTPVARAQIRVEGSGRMWGGGDGAQTLDDGSFTIDGVAPGTYRVIAARDGSWGSAMRAPGKTDDDRAGEKVEVRAGETARVELVVESQAGVIRGRVVDAHGAPVTDAFVDAERESDSAAAAEGQTRRTMRWSWMRAPVLTDTEGAFTIEKLSPGTYTVRAFRRGGGEALAEHVAVGTSVTITIHETGSIAGVVTREGGGPPETLMVEVQAAATGFHRREEFFRTGGAFAMRDLPAGEYDLAVSAAEGTGATKVTLAEGQELRGVTIALTARAHVKGRLVAADTGAPLAGYLVQVSPARASDGVRVSFGSDMPLSKADGTFDLPNVPAGRVQVVAWPVNAEDAGYGFLRRFFTLEAGETTDVGDLAIPKARAKLGEEAGDLGFELKESGFDADPATTKLEVAIVRPDGPAAKAGLKVGDVIVAVDGHPVAGDPFEYWTYAHVPPGTTVAFGLERGATVTITAGPPRT